MKSSFKIRIFFILTALALIFNLASAPCMAQQTKEAEKTKVMEKNKPGKGSFKMPRIPYCLAWVKFSNEYKFCVKQAYENAGIRLKTLAEDENPGEWCVVFDMDETLVSNVDFALGLLKEHKGLTMEEWYQWIADKKATALPGTVDFTKLVHELGGKVIVITNRDEVNREATFENLKEVGIEADAFILKEGPYKDDENKSMRRSDLEKGTVKTVKDLPPLKILMLAGDQTHDLYDEKTMTFDEAMEHFSQNFIIIPNPYYGGWTKFAE